jgi:hypothetical protein
MAIQTMVLDPNAASYTDDQIVAKINTATANITRASAVSAAAHPIGTGEVADTMIANGAIKTKLGAAVDGNKLVSSSLATAAGVTNAQIAVGQAKANLDAMTDTARGYVKTSPTTGQFRVVAIQRDAAGKAAISYDDTVV